MNKLLVVGTMAYDSIQTPYDKVENILGGAATYISLAASNFDINICIVSVIGEDFKSNHIDVLEKRNINLTGVEKIKGGKTFFWSGKYRENFNIRDTLKTKLNVLENFSPEVPSKWKNSKILLLGNLHPEVQLLALNQMSKKPELIILDTMNFWIDNFRETLDKVISGVDIICINNEEALDLTQQKTLVEAANKIQKCGPKYVIIKKGEHGAMIFNEENVFFSPAFPLKTIKDPTGAGDSFVGSFAGYLTQTNNFSFEGMKAGLIYASAIASFSVEQFGTYGLQSLNKKMIKDRITKLLDLTNFDSALINLDLL
ncbi:MAG: sugar kinase [Flavobacteriaceae bacterium]|nr:sugar kinase [Flavobacteriaceae bacterium]